MPASGTLYDDGSTKHVATVDCGGVFLVVLKFGKEQGSFRSFFLEVPAFFDDQAECPPGNAQEECLPDYSDFDMDLDAQEVEDDHPYVDEEKQPRKLQADPNPDNRVVHLVVKLQNDQKQEQNHPVHDEVADGHPAKYGQFGRVDSYHGFLHYVSPGKSMNEHPRGHSRDEL